MPHEPILELFVEQFGSDFAEGVPKLELGPLLHQCEMRDEVETLYEAVLSFGTERKVLNSVQLVSQTLINPCLFGSDNT